MPSVIITLLKAYVDSVAGLLKCQNNIRRFPQNYLMLIWASGNEFYEIVRNFLMTNLTKLVKLYNCTSLLCAALIVHLAIIAELLKHDFFNNEPSNNLPNVIQEFLECITNLKKDVNGDNICDELEAIKKGFGTFQKYIGNELKDRKISYEWTALRSHLDFVQEMLQNTVDVEVVNKTGYVMLSKATSPIHLQIVEKLANDNEDEKVLELHQTSLISCINQTYLAILNM